MAIKRVHHYLPRFYLRGFTDPSVPAGQEPYVWVRDQRSGVITRRAPKNLAAENGFYALETLSGRDYETVENELSEMESRAAMALRRHLLSPPGTRGVMPPELSAFVAWQAARVPWQRRVADEEWQRFLRDVGAGLKEAPDDPAFRVLLVRSDSREQRRETIQDALRLLQSGKWVPRFDQNQQIEMMRMQAWYYGTQHFPRLTWALLTAPNNWHFVTSDRPVVWFLPSRGYADSPAALNDRDVEVTVPLDARHALLGLGRPLQAGLRVTVDAVNQRTVGSAERLVIASKPDFP